MLSLFLFFFKRSGPPRDLPSSPTARSSDLAPPPQWPIGAEPLYRSAPLQGPAERDLVGVLQVAADRKAAGQPRDRDAEGTRSESTRLNSSHANISYAVFCLKKKKQYANAHA